MADTDRSIWGRQGDDVYSNYFKTGALMAALPLSFLSFPHLSLASFFIASRVSIQTFAADESVTDHDFDI